MIGKVLVPRLNQTRFIVREKNIDHHFKIKNLISIIKIKVEEKPQKPKNYDGAFNSQQSLDYTGIKNETLNVSTPLLASTHRHQQFH